MRLGEMLIERRLIEPEDLERALEMQRERPDKIGKILVDLGFVAMRDVLAALSAQLSVPLVTIDGPPPASPETEGLAPRFMRQCRFLPVAIQDSTLTIAMADPLDFETLSAVRGYTGLKVQPALAAEQEILDAIDKYYGEEEKAAEELPGDLAEVERGLRAPARHGQRGAGHPAGERHDRPGRGEARQRHPHRAVREGIPRFATAWTASCTARSRRCAN